MAGKGSKRRPGDEEKYRKNWDDIFSKKKEKKDERRKDKSDDKTGNN
jgi:hypothetical protein